MKNSGVLQGRVNVVDTAPLTFPSGLRTAANIRPNTLTKYTIAATQEGVSALCSESFRDRSDTTDTHTNIYKCELLAVPCQVDGLGTQDSGTGEPRGL